MIWGDYTLLHSVMHSVRVNKLSYEAKIEESEKAGSRQESNPGHLWLEPPVRCHWATTAGQPPTLTILYMYCTGETECLSCTPGSQIVRAGGCPAVVAQWQATAGFFTSLYFHLITSKFIYFQREARCSQHSVRVSWIVACCMVSTLVLDWKVSKSTCSPIIESLVYWIPGSCYTCAILPTILCRCVTHLHIVALPWQQS